ncbi:hypothetical protein K0B04_01490 [Patescibacteria group bacterium]|nr:hypothetical protein [Patescibacteria group bacterium]
MSISRFYDRNKPIFTIGAVIAIVFVGIIIFYRLKPHKETGLYEVGENDKDFYKVNYEGQDVENEYRENVRNVETEKAEESIPEPAINVDEVFGTISINYTDEGFRPRIVRAYLSQNVTWTNTTNRVLYFHQRKLSYPGLGETFEIKPGESFSHRMSELGIWAYEEKETRHYGSIEVKELPKKLPETITE